MKSAVVVLVVTLFVASLAQDVAVAAQVQPQVDYKAELNKLSSKFAQLRTQVAANVEKMKNEGVSDDIKAKLENMKTEVGKAVENIDLNDFDNKMKTFAGQIQTKMAENQPKIQAAFEDAKPKIEAAVADAKAKAPGFFENVKNRFANWFDNQA